jgi:hypothetical protein
MNETVPSEFRARVRALFRWNRRPVVLATISFVCLLVHHVVVRLMAHGHVAHLLLSGGHGLPPPRAAALAVTLVIGRFVSVILVPGLLLAAAAELAAYLLVGPTQPEEVDDPLDGAS